MLANEKQIKLWNEPVYLLISMKAVFYDMIVNGQKDVEFRKAFPDCPTRTFVYVKKPVAAIPILMELGPPIADPLLLKDRHGYGVEDFRSGEKPGRKALPIEAVQRLSRSVPLAELLKYRVLPPQSYIYLSRKPRLLGLLLGLL